MNRKISLAPGEYYHVYNRGVEKRQVFLTSEDHERFKSLLYLSNGTKPIVYNRVRGPTLYSADVGEKLTAVGAYVLMPNHFHLLLKETNENGITEFMRKLTTAYSMYFNKRHERVGHLFQGTFKAEHLDTDEYLKYIYAYIHLNPIKLIQSKWREEGIANPEAAQKYLRQYQHSSFHHYVGEPSKEGDIISTDEFPEYFTGTANFEQNINDWLMYEVGPRTV